MIATQIPDCSSDMKCLGDDDTFLGNTAGGSHSLAARLSRRLGAGVGIEMGDAVQSTDDDFLLPISSLSGDLEIACASFGACSTTASESELKWRTLRFELKGKTLFFRTNAKDDSTHSAATFRKLSLDGVVAIKLERAIGPGQHADQRARRSMLMLTKPGHHVCLRLPIFSNSPPLGTWHARIADCLPEACRISSAGGSAAVKRHL